MTIRKNHGIKYCSTSRQLGIFNSDYFDEFAALMVDGVSEMRDRMKGLHCIDIEKGTAKPLSLSGDRFMGL